MEKEKHKKSKLKLILLIVIPLIFVSLVSFMCYSYIKYSNSGKAIIQDKTNNQYSTDVANIIYREGKSYLVSTDGREFLLLEGLGNKRFRILNDTGEVIGLDHYGNIQAIGNVTATDSTMNGYGFFTWIGSEVSRITKGWFHDLDVSGSINATDINGSTVYANNVNISTWITNISLNWTLETQKIFNFTTANLGTMYNLTASYIANKSISLTENVTMAFWNRSTTNLYPRWITDNIGLGGTTAPKYHLEVNKDSLAVNLSGVMYVTSNSWSGVNITKDLFNIGLNVSAWVTNVSQNWTAITRATYNSTWDNSWVNTWAYNQSTLYNLQNVLNDTNAEFNTINITAPTPYLYFKGGGYIYDNSSDLVLGHV